MTVSLPQISMSWMGQLANALGPQHQQQQQMGNGYFPPAPSAPGAAAPIGQPNSGSFLQRLIGQMPANQAATNQYPPTLRIGG